MSCTISVRDHPDGIWMIQNSIYAWFVRLVLQRGQYDEAVSTCLEMSVCTNGISLDALFEEDAGVAQGVVDRIQVVAREVAGGQHVLVAQDGSPRTDMQEKCNRAFAELVEMLGSFTGKSGGG